MVSKSFDINAGSVPPFESKAKRLMVELSAQSVTIILTDRATGLPEAVESFYGSHSFISDWESMLQQSRLLAFTDLETVVIVGYPNMMPIPAAMYAPEQASLQMELFFGSAKLLFTSGDVLAEAEMVVAWQIPLEEHDFLVNHFQWLQIKHAATVLLQVYRPRSTADGHIIIYGTDAWLMLWKDGVFTLARPVAFEKADDLCWYLLDMCRQFSLGPGDVNWQISGMIEQGSSLWEALLRFIDKVDAMPCDYQLETLPAHYFAHLLKNP